MNDAPDPAESRAIELLRLVGGETPAVSDRFTPDLVVRARRQRAIAVPLRVLGGFATALAFALLGAVQPGKRETQR
jgi:hypothetical protein